MLNLFEENSWQKQQANIIRRVYVYEFLLKPRGITIEEAEKPIKPLTCKNIQEALITGKIPKKLLIRLYQRRVSL